MKLYTFQKRGETTDRLGAEQGGRLIDLAQAARLAGGGLPSTLIDLIRAGETAMKRVRQALELAQANPADATLSFAFEEVRLRAPIPRPGKILCSGINYHGHFQENPNAKMPTEPFFFSKVPTAVIGSGDPIVRPAMTQQLDYEVELAVVIGQTLSRASEAEVAGSLAGFTILHDVSARDVQFKDSQITLGKNFDSFCPLGPCLVTADEFRDPQRRKLRTFLNGEIVQDGSTEDWVFTLPRLISFLSQVMTLEPGDLVSTGTPAGVGFFRKPQLFLDAGDRVMLEIEGIGRLENPVVDA